MKTLVIFLMTLIAGRGYVAAQVERKELNIVIVIDAKVLTGAMSRFRVIGLLENGTKETMEADYAPGNLALKLLDYNRLLSSNFKTTYLAFDYTENCKDDQIIHNYEIDIKKGWLEHHYYVLYIYNTDKKQFKDVYDPLEGKNY